MVMDRRILCVGLAVLGSSFMLLTGVASARGASPTVAPGTCEVKSLPSFMAQGEFATTSTVGDVIEISCDPYTYSQGAKVTVTASQLYDRCGKQLTWYVPEGSGDDSTYSSRSVQLSLDVNGNANVGLIAGPRCMVGGSLITVDENEAPFETYITEFKVLPTENTKEGLFITPEKQVQDQETSSNVTIAQVEFSKSNENHVRIGAQQLYDRCRYGDKLEWVRENRSEAEETGELLNAIELDNNGNGFVLLLGESSCMAGPSKIEADLEEAPYTTLEPQDITIESPRVR
jgi:hypothetical protein